MPVDKIEIEVLAKGLKKVQTDIDKIKTSLKGAGTTAKENETVMSGVANRIKTSWLALGAAVTASVIGIKKAFDFTKEAARFQQSMTAARMQFGVDADVMISKLREVSKGTISNADLIESANRAMALNVTKDLGKMTKLLEVARIRGQAMGLDTSQAFNDIVTGIGRGSPLILDNLGIITKGWAEEAKAAGVAMDAQFILNKVLADGAELLEKAGDNGITAAEKIQSFEAGISNLRLELGEALLPALAGMLKTLKPLLDIFGKLPKPVKALIGVVAILTPALIALNIAAGPIGLILGGIAVASLAVAAAFQTQSEETENVTKSLADLREELFNQIKEYDKAITLVKSLSAGQKTLKDLNEKQRKKLLTLAKALGFFNKIANGTINRMALLNLLTHRRNKLLEQNSRLENKNRKSREESTAADEDGVEIKKKLTKADAARLEQLLAPGKDPEIASIEMKIKALKRYVKEYELTKEKIQEINIKIAEFTSEIEGIELSGRLNRLAEWSKVVGKTAGVIVQIEQNKLDSIDEHDERARKKQKKRIRNAAIFQKAVSLATTIIEVAAGVAKAIAKKEYADAVLIAALGAAEIATISATPIPAFRQGSAFTPGGMAIVGERGPELVRLPQGASVTPNQNINNETVNTNNVNITVNADDPIDFVNRMRREYGVNVFNEA